MIAPISSALARRMRRWLGRAEIVDHHAHRDAGAAILARRAIGDGLRATEAGLGQHVVERGGALADEMGEHLALQHARQIGAGRRGGEIELGGVPHFPRHAFALLPAARGEGGQSERLKRIARNGNGRTQM